MKPIRVLIVDDSIVIRRILSELISGETDLAVAGTAATPLIALEKLANDVPDVVVMDVEMPEMDGIEAARRIHARWPKLPIVMCSTMTEKGADTTLKALEAGATDYVTKPNNLGSREAAVEYLRGALLPKLRDVTSHLVPAPTAAAPPVVPTPEVARNPSLGRFQPTLVNPLPRSGGGLRPADPPSPVPPASGARLGGPSPAQNPFETTQVRARVQQSISLVAIGCSTGGPNALSDIFKTMSPNLGVPIVVVQHMPPLFTKMLAERLSLSSQIKVLEAENGMELQPGYAYLAPGDYHMEIVRDRTLVKIALNQKPHEHSCRPAVDITFASAAAIYGRSVLGVILTGMGQDGTRGARAIVEAGGVVITQDRETCVVPTMPASVAAAGLSEADIKLADMSAEIARRVQRGSVFQASMPLMGRGAP